MTLLTWDAVPFSVIMTAQLNEWCIRKIHQDVLKLLDISSSDLEKSRLLVLSDLKLSLMWQRLFTKELKVLEML
jgi:hypothetical protein